jgi:hypothetical protein
MVKEVLPETPENIFSKVRGTFSSLDKFTKSFILVTMLIILATPFVVTTFHLFASTVPLVSVEAEDLALSGPVSVQTDSSASGGKYLQFTGSSSVGFQPSTTYYATFFYPWYQNPNTDGLWSDWQDNSHNPPTNWFSNYIPDRDPNSFNPSAELYSSSNYDIFKWQLNQLAQAKQEVAISSWWGQGHKTDTAFSKIIKDYMNRADNPYPNLRWALYYEYEGNVNSSTGNSNPSVTQITNDLNYIASNYANQPAYLKVNGKPVIFVYGDAADGGSTNTNCSDSADTSMTHRWWLANSKASTKFYVVLKLFPGFASVPCQPDDWHQYSPAVRTDSNAPYSFAVSPGFWKNGDSVRLPRDLTAFEAGVKSMVASSARWKLTETWNEWGEGTSVEPGNQVIQATGSTPAVIDPNGATFGSSYVSVLNRDLPSLPQGVGAASTPGQTSTPTPTGKPTATPTKAPNATAAPTKSPTATPQPSGGNDPIIFFNGDLVSGSSVARAQQVVTLIKNLMSQHSGSQMLVASIGDNEQESAPTLANYQQYFGTTYGTFVSMGIFKQVRGNHDVQDTGHGAAYATYFGSNSHLDANGLTNYSYNLGTWHIIGLDELNGSVNANSLAFLKSDLAANSGNKCQIVYWHVPTYSSGASHGDSTGLKPLNQAEYDAGVDIQLNGHDHDYQRFYPLNPSGVRDDAKGITTFIDGIGGEDSRSGSKTSIAQAASAVYLDAFGSNHAIGVVMFTLHSSSADYALYDANTGSILDQGTINCH